MVSPNKLTSAQTIQSQSFELYFDLSNGMRYSSDKQNVPGLHLQCDPRFDISNMKQKYLKFNAYLFSLHSHKMLNRKYVESLTIQHNFHAKI
jgi:hypothetical protein